MGEDVTLRAAAYHLHNKAKMCEADSGEERLHPPSLANGLLSKSVSQRED